MRLAPLLLLGLVIPHAAGLPLALPDFEVSGLAWRYADEDAGLVRVSARVTNVGDEASSGLLITGGRNSVVNHVISVGRLDSGQTVDVEFDTNICCVQGMHTYYVQADSDDTVVEADERNNRLEGLVPFREAAAVVLAAQPPVSLATGAQVIPMALARVVVTDVAMTCPRGSATLIVTGVPSLAEANGFTSPRHSAEAPRLVSATCEDGVVSKEVVAEISPALAMRLNALHVSYVSSAESVGYTLTGHRLRDG